MNLATEVIGAGASPQGVRRLYSRNAAIFDGVIFTRFDQSFRVAAPTVAINHGVDFDGLRLHRRQILRAAQIIRERLRMHWQPLVERRRSLRVNKVICVDTNFPNYMRAAFPHEAAFWNEHLKYVPNFASIPDEQTWRQKWAYGARFTVAFPRRFESTRGVQEWIAAVSQLAPAWPNIDFVFAGGGHFDDEVRALEQEHRNVSAFSVKPDEMPALYSRVQIVVVPSQFSEGTSLSALEGMAHGCATVTTAIGGLGNIVLPDFNGVICGTSTAALVAAVTELLHHRGEAERLAGRAREVVASAFSQETWKIRIGQVLSAAGVVPAIDAAPSRSR